MVLLGNLRRPGVERGGIPPLPDPEAKQKNQNESRDEPFFTARQFEHPATLARFPDAARGCLMKCFCLSLSRGQEQSLQDANGDVG